MVLSQLEHRDKCYVIKICGKYKNKLSKIGLKEKRIIQVINKDSKFILLNVFGSSIILEKKIADYITVFLH